MTEDAKFSEGAERPLKLIAVDEGDLAVISTFLQDAVLARKDISWIQEQSRFAALVSRFRWEDAERARERGERYERVRAVLNIEDVSSASSKGIDHSSQDELIYILSVDFKRGRGKGVGGTITLNMANHVEIRLEVSCVNVSLADVTRPYYAASEQLPEHSGDGSKDG